MCSFDHYNKLCDGINKKMLASSMLITEALAVREACRLFGIQFGRKASLFGDLVDFVGS